MGKGTEKGKTVYPKHKMIFFLKFKRTNLNFAMMEEEGKTHQLVYMIGFLTALKGRLNPVCETI